MTEPRDPEPVEDQPAAPPPAAPPATEWPLPRIGDADRDQAVSYLQEHLARGRLTNDEFEERMTAALQAKTAADLDPLFADLPDPRPGKAKAPVFEPPPWQRAGYRDPAPAAAVHTYAEPSQQPLPVPRPEQNRALAVVAGIAWPVTLLVLFATSWHFWWLIFVPIIITGVIGNQRRNRR